MHIASPLFSDSLPCIFSNVLGAVPANQTFRRRLRTYRVVGVRVLLPLGPTSVFAMPVTMASSVSGQDAWSFAAGWEGRLGKQRQRLYKRVQGTNGCTATKH